MYLFLVIFILAILGLLAYYLYLKEKSIRLKKVEKGICPNCNQDSIEIKRSKSGGCSGVRNIIFKCQNCDFEEEFNIFGSSCNL